MASQANVDGRWYTIGSPEHMEALQQYRARKTGDNVESVKDYIPGIGKHAPQTGAMPEESVDSALNATPPDNSDVAAEPAVTEEGSSIIDKIFGKGE